MFLRVTDTLYGETKLMKCMLLIYANTSEAPVFTPEERQVAMQAWMAYSKEASAAGVLVSNEALTQVSERRSAWAEFWLI